MNGTNEIDHAVNQNNNSQTESQLTDLKSSASLLRKQPTFNEQMRESAEQNCAPPLPNVDEKLEDECNPHEPAKKDVKSPQAEEDSPLRALLRKDSSSANITSISKSEQCDSTPDKSAADVHDDSDDDFRVRLKIVKTYGKQRPPPNITPVSSHSPEQGFPIDCSYSDGSPTSSRPSNRRIGACNDVTSVYFESSRYDSGLDRDNNTINCSSSVNGLTVKGFDIMHDDYSLLGTNFHQPLKHDNCEVLNVSPHRLKYTNLDDKDSNHTYEDISDNELNRKRKARKRQASSATSDWTEVCHQAIKIANQGNHIETEHGSYHTDMLLDHGPPHMERYPSYDGASHRDSLMQPIYENEYMSSMPAYHISEPTAAGDCPTYHHDTQNIAPLPQYHPPVSLTASPESSSKSALPRPYPELNRAISSLATEIGGPSYAMEFCNLNFAQGNMDYTNQSEYYMEQQPDYQWASGQSFFANGQWYSHLNGYQNQFRNNLHCNRYASYPVMPSCQSNQYPAMQYCYGSTPYVLGSHPYYMQRPQALWPGQQMHITPYDASHYGSGYFSQGTYDASVPHYVEPLSNVTTETSQPVYEETQHKPESYIVTYATSSDSSPVSTTKPGAKLPYVPDTEAITPVQSLTQVEKETEDDGTMCQATSEPSQVVANFDNSSVNSEESPIDKDVMLQSADVHVQTSFIAYPNDVMAEQFKHNQNDGAGPAFVRLDCSDSGGVTESESECDCYIPHLLQSSSTSDMVLSISPHSCP